MINDEDNVYYDNVLYQILVRFVNLCFNGLGWNFNEFNELYFSDWDRIFFMRMV